MSEQDKIWVRSVRYHSYLNVLREPDTFYQVNDLQDLETVTAQQVAVRDTPPQTASRETPATPAPAAVPSARVMTVADMQPSPNEDRVAGPVVRPRKAKPDQP